MMQAAASAEAGSTADTSLLQYVSSCISRIRLSCKPLTLTALRPSAPWMVSCSRPANVDSRKSLQPAATAAANTQCGMSTDQRIALFYSRPAKVDSRKSLQPAAMAAAKHSAARQ